MRPKGRIVISWDDPEDAEAVAQVLMDAAMRDGKVRDQGFKEDADFLFQKAMELRAEEAEDEAVDW